MNQTAKNLFAQNKNLRDDFAAMVQSDKFQTALVYVTAAWLEGPVNEQQILGMRSFVETLNSICEPDPPASEFPKTGLHHNLEILPRTGEEKKE